MRTSIYSSLFALPFALSGTIHQRDPGAFPQIPNQAKAPNSFNSGKKMEGGQPPQTNTLLPDVYRARDIDIPFGRLLHGKLMYFKAGEMNTADGIKDDGAVGEADDAKQSACGIPDNAYSNSKVAIHPYWLKYAGLDRYCQQDVCVCFRTETGSDMISKVTDICSTDPTDPSHCASPEDIKLPRTKVQVLRYKTHVTWNEDPEFSGYEDTQGIWWYLCKCLGEAIVQDAFKGPNTDNWFSTPDYPENNADAVQVTFAQYKNNQDSYGAKGWTLYGDGILTKPADLQNKHSPVTDWVPGQEPDWQPVAGGEGFGKPHGKDVNQLNGKFPNGSGGTTNNGTTTSNTSTSNTEQSAQEPSGSAQPDSNMGNAGTVSKPSTMSKAPPTGTNGDVASGAGPSTTPSTTPSTSTSDSATAGSDTSSDDTQECEL